MVRTLHKVGVKVETNILEERYTEALSAAKEFFLAKDVNGIKLCWMGRVVRAMARAAEIEPTKQQDYRALVNGLVEQAEAANRRQKETWDTYIETARFAAEKPVLIDLPQCQCEGCRLIEENNRLIVGDV